jgi:uncharacterized protein (DUF2336 family)
MVMSYLKKWLSGESTNRESFAVLNENAYHQVTSENAAASESAALILRDIFSTPETAKTTIEIRSDGIQLEQNGTLTRFGLDDLENYRQMDEQIRYHIARKISMLAPVLAKEEKHFLLLYVIRVLKALAEDQTIRVRQIIAEELRDSPNAPPEVIVRLARDNALPVATPVLRYSPLLSDYELLDIIASANLPGVVEAIAQRRELSDTVSGAIIDSDNEAAIFNLLCNRRTVISDQNLNKIADKAANHEIWHEPLVYRPELTQKTVNKIAMHISEALLQKLKVEAKLDSEMLLNIEQAVTARLNDRQLDISRTAENEVKTLFYSQRLTRQIINEKLENGEKEFVVYSLALLSDLSYTYTQRILSSENPKEIIALAWKAGLSMRDAIQIQLRLANIHHKDILYAHEGVDYPFSDKKMLEILHSATR